MSVEDVVAARPVSRKSSGRSFGGSFDRLFYPGMAWLFVVVAVVGFGPRSTAILGGAMANPPLIVHMHAAVMASWVLLLAAQASLSVAGRIDLHRKLGLAALALAPAVLVMLAAVTVARQTAAAGTPAHEIVNNILFLQIRSILLFPLFFIWAMATRASDPQTHKRMILLATLMLLDAAIARMSWLPFNAFPTSYLAVHVYLVLLLVPAMVYDLVRLGRVHRAYVWGLAIVVPWVVATELVWGTSWWMAWGPRLVGVAG